MVNSVSNQRRYLIKTVGKDILLLNTQSYFIIKQKLFDDLGPILFDNIEAYGMVSRNIINELVNYSARRHCYPVDKVATSTF